jgi:threonine/homoserine/homoserine lactone efflux protein
MDSDTFVLLITACLAINLSPGPRILFASSIAAKAGLRPALAGVLGMSAAALFYAFLAATGLATIIAASPILFYSI